MAKKNVPFNAKEVTALVSLLRDEGTNDAIVQLVLIVSGRDSRNDLESVVKTVSVLAPILKEDSKRDIDSVKPHATPLQDPSVRGSIRPKVRELDAPTVKPRKRKKK